MLYLIVGAILVIWIIAVFNSLVRKRNQTKNAWSDIDVQLKRRYDLIPNLVEAVKGYMAHEKNLLVQLIEVRTAAIGAGSNLQARSQAEESERAAVKVSI